MTLVQKVLPPAWFLRVLRARSALLVFEIDDAIYLGYPGQEKQAWIQRERVDAAVRVAHRVTTSNQRIADDLGLSNNVDVVVFPGPAPKLRNVNARTGAARVLWLGSPSTYPYFEQMFATLNVDATEASQSFVAVGAPLHANSNGALETRAWTFDVERSELERSTIGVMPIEPSAWADRKAAYKVLEYLSANIIPVFEPSPATRLLLGGESDVLAVSVVHGNWAEAIEHANRMDIGEDWLSARDRVFDRWSTSRFTDAILEGTKSYR